MDFSLNPFPSQKEGIVSQEGAAPGSAIRNFTCIAKVLCTFYLTAIHKFCIAICIAIFFYIKLSLQTFFSLYFQLSFLCFCNASFFICFPCTPSINARLKLCKYFIDASNFLHSLQEIFCKEPAPLCTIHSPSGSNSLIQFATVEALTGIGPFLCSAMLT